MRVSRRLAALCGMALFGIALTACEDQASGVIEGRKGTTVQTISNPPIDGCHRFVGSVEEVHNRTGSDIKLYTTPDCTVPKNGDSKFLGTGLSDDAVASTGLWQSFTFAPG
ncbi:hypothetical protein [Streptomyces mangrovisoli]|uniref:Uncharacterized protein n=1 Tax=Streptomyces mangrovisoli TaxID=1428628 RepID=A0A1J4P099_9ACTN|nr:hypothetical protein [Streptomyces mangrovisoli]OIJ66846.1 hypothetical protein WN71_015545 [Streptomyces mangrovisoli]